MQKKLSSLIQAVLAVSMLVVFPACENPFSKKHAADSPSTSASHASTGSGQVLASLKSGKALVTEEDFKAKIAQQLKASPYTANMSVDSIPLPAQRKFLDEIVNVELIAEWGVNENISSSAAFKKEFDEAVAALKKSLIAKRFVEDLQKSITVSDEEVRQDYNKNKSRYVKTPGGVLLSAVQFGSKSEAQQFFAAVKDKPAAFATVAKKQDLKLREFGRVSKDAQGPARVREELRDAALALKKFPGVELVKLDNDFWVICGSDKQTASYYELAEIEGQLKNMLQANRFNEVLEKRLEGLKKEYPVEVNEAYFKDAAPSKEEVEDSKGIDIAQAPVSSSAPIAG